MSSITEQFSAATRSQLEAQIKIFNTFASTAVDSAEKVIALNLSTTKASVEKSSAAAKKLFDAKDPREFFSLNAVEPASFDKLLAYGRELYNIASGVQSELMQSAQSTIKQVTDLAAAPVTALKPALKATPSVLAAAVSAAVAPVAAATPEVAAAVAAATDEPIAAPVAAPEVAAVAEVAEAKAAKVAAKPKTAAAPIPASPAPVAVEVAAAKPSFPAPPAKPTLKSVPPAKAKHAGKQLDMLSSKAKK